MPTLTSLDTIWLPKMRRWQLAQAQNGPHQYSYEVVVSFVGETMD